jgi:hypothetical protein
MIESFIDVMRESHLPEVKQHCQAAVSEIYAAYRALLKQPQDQIRHIRNEDLGERWNALESEYDLAHDCAGPVNNNGFSGFCTCSGEKKVKKITGSGAKTLPHE